jgi:hypothetical protein
VHVVSQDGSPHGPKSFVLWNPPLTMPPQQPGGSGEERPPRISHTEGRLRSGSKRWRDHQNLPNVPVFLCMWPEYMEVRHQAALHITRGVPPGGHKGAFESGQD